MLEAKLKHVFKPIALRNKTLITCYSAGIGETLKDFMPELRVRHGTRREFRKAADDPPFQPSPTLEFTRRPG